jgi:anti-sigma B factor antagonist
MVETKTQQVGDVTVVEMTGRLHFGNSLIYVENSVNCLIDGGTRQLVLDLANVEYVDSSGLGMLIGCAGRMKRNGDRMCVAGSHGAVSEVFEVVHADRILKLDADLDSACRHLSAESAAG